MIRENGFGPFYNQGREFLRRIFVTVRDRNWQEICATERVVTTDGPVVTFSARHTSSDVDFQWKGRLLVGHDGLQFSFEGRANRDMEICRLGLVVLHPIESMIGSRLTTRGPRGSESLVLTDAVQPQPMIGGTPGAITQPFSELLVEREDFGTLRMRLSGDLFELEDQRNWGDASFKTYCTPLRLGFPRPVKAGTEIAHSVEVQYVPASARDTAASGVSPANAGATPGRRPKSGRFPAIGTQWPATGGGYIQVDLTGEDPVGQLTACLNSSAEPLELAVKANYDPAIRGDLIKVLTPHRARIARILGYDTAAPPSTRHLAHWTQRLGDIPLYAATRGYFVEFNRGVPSEASGIAFPWTATVHADDPLTIAENVSTIQYIARAARRPIAIAPLAFYHPPRTATFPQELRLPWLTSTLIHAALANVATVTLVSDVLQELDGVQPVSTLCWLTGCTGLEVTPLETDLPQHVHAVRVLAEDGATIARVAANLTGAPVQIGSNLAIPAFGVLTA